jgi:hypothetical protein
MITNDDIMHAIKISQTLQEYFDKNKPGETLRSTDAYEILVNKNVVERDRHNGIKFREFLAHLKRNNELYHIPQCRPESTSGNTTNWFFQTAPEKTIRVKNLKPIELAGKVITIDMDKVRSKINAFPKCDTSKFTHIQFETREKYKRAYEYWTLEEEQLLVEVAREITDAFKLSELFKRQPSALKNRLRDRFKIII